MTRVVAVQQSLAEPAFAERRQHGPPDDLAREAIGDEFLEPVSHLDAHAPLGDGEEDEHAVVLTALTNARLLEEAYGVLLDVREWRDGLDGDHDDGVARGLLEGPDPAIQFGGRTGVDDRAEVVDRAGQRRKRLGDGGAADAQPDERGRRRGSRS